MPRNRNLACGCCLLLVCTMTSCHSLPQPADPRKPIVAQNRPLNPIVPQAYSLPTPKSGKCPTAAFTYTARATSRATPGVRTHTTFYPLPTWSTGAWSRLRLPRKARVNKLNIRTTFCMPPTASTTGAPTTCTTVCEVAAREWPPPPRPTARLKKARPLRASRVSTRRSLWTTTDRRICFGDRPMPREPDSARTCVPLREPYTTAC